MFQSLLVYLLELLRPDGFVVSKISKTTLMGNIYDNTLGYYLSTAVITPLDSDIRIEYKLRGKLYICPCEPEYFEECLEYISKDRVQDKSDFKVKFAYIYEGECIKDITDLVESFAGPKFDFNKGTGFHVKKRHITGDTLYIIDNHGKSRIFFIEEEYIII